MEHHDTSLIKSKLSFCFIFIPVDFLLYIQQDNRKKWSQAKTNPDFSVERGADSLGASNIQFCQIFQKNAWNWEKFQLYGAHPGPTNAKV